MASSKAEIVGAIVGVLGLLGVGFGLYGGYTSTEAAQHARLITLEKEQKVSAEKIGKMEDELDVLWVDTQKNSETLKVIDKRQERSDDAFIKFADAVERLSVSVARLEEQIKARNGA